MVNVMMILPVKQTISLLSIVLCIAAGAAQPAFAQQAQQGYCDSLDLQALNAECAETSQVNRLLNFPGLPTADRDTLVTGLGMPRGLVKTSALAAA